MNSFREKLEKGLFYFCITLLAVSVSLLVVVIFLRAAFGIGYDFLADTVVWLTIWATMLYIGPLYGQREHVAITFVLEKLRGKTKAGFETLNALATLFYVGTVTVGGCISIYQLYTQHQVYARYIAIPMWIVQLCVPLGFGLMAVYAIAELLRIFQGREPSSMKTT